ncbi:MAG TPA: hypothetical protein VIG80_08030 [Bacillaceae bacterium]
MRAAEKNQWSSVSATEVFGIDFNSNIEREHLPDLMETAHEFGLSWNDIRSCKKRLERS